MVAFWALLVVLLASPLRDSPGVWPNPGDLLTPARRSPAMLEDLLYGPDGWFTICPPPDWWHRALAENKAPFPWFGGKSKVVDLVWDRFGDVKNYVEPFVGSMAVLLGRPHATTIETVNDYDCFVSNFWRAIQADPDKVAEYADWPVNECDLHARHKWLVKRKAVLRARLLEDPDFYSAKIAGWWVWGLCAWIGSGWCSGPLHSKMPAIAHASERGINSGAIRQRLPHLGAGTGGEDDHACAHHGKGVHGKGMRLSEQLPDISGNGNGKTQSGVHSKTVRSRLHEVFQAIAQRLRYTRITCGDFERILSPAVTWRHGTTGVFLDPPYPPDAGCEKNIYASSAGIEREVFDRAFRYCVANGDHRDLRIALCYYEGTCVDGENVSDKLRSLGWEIVPWKAGGGYGGQNGKGNENASRERIAFSPHCLQAKQRSLF